VARLPTVATDLSVFQTVHTGSGLHLGSWTAKLTTHLHLVTWLRMIGVKPPLPHTPSWRAQAQLVYAPTIIYL